jgi:hypothetical protein
MGIIATILMLVLYALMLGAGIYFKSYFDKKGANLATKEDFRDLKAQTAELRQATKEIEAKIDEQVWNKQRQWEMKKEILLEGAKRLAEVDESLLKFGTAKKLVFAQPTNITLVENQNKCANRWDKASAAFDESRLLIEIACDNELAEAFSSLGVFANNLAAALSADNFQFYQTSQRELFMKRERARLAIRKSLGLEVDATPQSNESSAAPTPG